MWVRPKFVYSVEEVGAWKAAGLTIRCRHARVDSSPIPASVIETRIDGVLALRHPDPGGRPGEVGPARRGACPTAVVTERYFYALWHHCHPDVATDVIEVDFDATGQEVSRYTRPLPARPTTSPRTERSQVTHDQHGLGKHVFCPACGTGSNVGDSFCRRCGCSLSRNPPGSGHPRSQRHTVPANPTPTGAPSSASVVRQRRRWSPRHWFLGGVLSLLGQGDIAHAMPLALRPWRGAAFSPCMRRS